MYKVCWSTPKGNASAVFSTQKTAQVFVDENLMDTHMYSVAEVKDDICRCIVCNFDVYAEQTASISRVIAGAYRNWKTVDDNSYSRNLFDSF
jgi:hypothetical protein